MSRDTPVSVSNLKYTYGKYEVLDGVSLDIRKGEVLGVLGPNGCGKTTFLRNLNRNLIPHGGCILLDGKKLEEITKKDIAKKMAVVPQTNEINFSFTVREIVSMGRMPFQPMFGGETNEDTEIIDDAIRRTGLDRFAERHINTMSGGERQRVIIARAIAQTPTALNLVHNLSREKGMTVVIVSHDLGMVARYCDRIVMIHKHKIFADGTPEEVLTPENMRTVFNVDAELSTDNKTGRRTVLIHDSCTYSLDGTDQ